MNYLDVIGLVFGILSGILGIFYIHFVFVGAVGVFTHKRFKRQEEKLKYGIVVSARNESLVIANLINSIRSCDYPQDKLDIFVIAHNCTDNTAEVASNLGAIVYEYNNKNEATKGYALKKLFSLIEADYKTSSYAGFFVFDADNVFEKDYFQKMNDAFIAKEGKAVITSFRNSKNFGYNLMSGMYGVYFVYGCDLEMAGRTALGISTRVSGTGYLFNSKVVQNGWPYVTLTEDWEFTADQVIAGNEVTYCHEAELFDEQPTDFKIMWRQRVRWSRGHLLVCVTRLKDIVKNFFKRGKGVKRVSLFDLTSNILPSIVIFFILGILQFILTLFAPLFGISLGTALGRWALQFGISFAFSNGGMALLVILCYFLERKRIHGVTFWQKVALVFCFPLFIDIQVIIDFVALFKKNLGWKVIPHKDTTTIEKINDARKK